jgi:hypothetical protein
MWRVTPESCLLVKGPAKITVLSGEGHIFGYPIRPPMKVAVQKYKQFPVETEEALEVECVGGEVVERSYDSIVGTRA